MSKRTQRTAADSMYPDDPPVFTQRELHAIAWLVASLAWIPGEWTTEIGGIAKKLRIHFGDES